METETYQILDASQLAERLNLPESWIREQCRGRAGRSVALPATREVCTVRVAVTRA